MRIGPVPENPWESLGLRAARVPTPILETFHGLLMARSLMAACRLGLLEAMAEGPRTPEEVARECGCQPDPTGRLLEVLASMGYCRFEADRVRLTPLARRWLLASSPTSLRDYVIFRYREWEFVEGLEDHLRTGQPMVESSRMDRESWGLYQRGMRAVSRLGAPEVARRTPVPASPRRLLDIGGGHGALAAAFCRRHPGLTAQVLDLPEAVEHAAPLLAEEELGDRLSHWPGDVFQEDLGEARYDVILMANFLHHFPEPTCRDLVGRAARALRSGGVLACVDFFRPEDGHSNNQMVTLMHLYFAMTSGSATWTAREVAGWQRDAALLPHRPSRLRRAPGASIQAATRL